MISMRIILDDKRIDAEGVYSASDLYFYLMDECRKYHGFPWIDSESQLHCEYYYNSFDNNLTDATNLYHRLCDIYWFEEYCIFWKAYSDRDIFDRKVEYVIEKDLLAYSERENGKFTHVGEEMPISRDKIIPDNMVVGQPTDDPN